MVWDPPGIPPYRVANVISMLECVSTSDIYANRFDFQNYLPLPQQPRLTTLARKRREYAQLVEQAFGRGMTPADAQVGTRHDIPDRLFDDTRFADMASNRNRCAAH